MRRLSVIVLLILSVAVVSAAAARKFSWDATGDICYPDVICRTYIYVWDFDYYASIVTGDSIYDEASPPPPVEVPSDKQDILKQNYLSKILVLPEGWDTIEFEVTSANFPAIINGNRYVFVAVNVEINSSGYENESDFSNRIMWTAQFGGPSKPINLHIVE